MKTPRSLLLGLLMLTSAAVFAQPPIPPPTAVAPTVARLTKFDLDFPGGTPGQLVAAIQQAMKRPLNVIIPNQLTEWKLPPLKMSNVDVAQLFRAFEPAGRSVTIRRGSSSNATQVESVYGFKTNSNAGFETDDSVWYFYAYGGASDTQKISRFYYLAPYLQGGLTVDDITTAVQTGWKMRGETSPPALSFHKETKLLIAFGDYDGLDVIDSVLKALDSVKPKPPAPEKPAPDPKTKP